MTAFDKVKAALEADGMVHYHAWTIMKHYITCSDGCCDTSFDSLEETLDHLEWLCSGEWDEVVIDD